MFTNHRHRKSLVRSSALCALVVLAAACGGGAQEESSPTDAAGSDPLLAGLLDGKSFEEAQFDVEKQVQQCMTALGWEYTAVAPSTEGMGMGGGIDSADMDTFAAESGYGVSTFAATDGVVATGAGDQGSDPNAAYVSKLSTSEQTAYYDDLYGTPPADADPSAPIEPAGCYGEASAAVFGEGAFEKLNDQFNEVSSRMASDQRMTDAYAKWSACMSAAGYTYSNPSEPYEDFAGRLSALGAQPDPAALQALQAEEIATAKADRACAKDADLDELQQKVFEEISAKVASGS